MRLEPFSRRVRGILEKNNTTLAALAEKAELDSSLVSKLLSDTEGARREPRIEHVIAIARALDMTPHDLATGTTAAEVLGEWVPREELEKESKARAKAQARVGNLETDLATSKAEASAAKNELERLSSQMATKEASARRELYSLRVASQTTEARLGACIVERDNAVQTSMLLDAELNNLRSRLQQAQRDTTSANGVATIGWLAALVAGTVVLGNNPPRRPRGRPRGS